MNMKLLQASLVLSLLTTQSHATLIERGGGMVYDSVQNITFLQNAKAADTRMTHEAAYTWTHALVHEGYDDWRLPYFFNECPQVVDPSNPNFNSPGYEGCSGSELSILSFVEFGNVTIHEGGATNTGPFLNVMGLDPYSLYHLERVGETPMSYADSFSGDFFFIFDTGRLSGEVRGFGGWAWAVRDGDVTSVPEPAALSLLMVGVLGLATRRRSLRCT